MFAPHFCSNRICKAIDDKKIEVEEFETIVKHNKVGINSSQHWFSWCELVDQVNYLPLNYACKIGDYDKVKILLDNGANPNKRDRSIKAMPLSYALRSGMGSRFKIANLLLDAGADPNAESRQSTPIFESLIIGKYAYDRDKLEKESLKLFMRLHKVTNSIEDPSGCDTILGAAAAYNNMRAVKYIMENKICGVNDTSNQGRTALMSCMQTDSGPGMCMFLLENGADRTIEDKEGRTAHDYAIKYGNKDCAEVLESYMEQ
ncbi:MAG: ankyrin repeat domain-containing protein [Bacillota bacterium]|nr:ankyrin repeat domain-containing protein [Bacillota bacterium]